MGKRSKVKGADGERQVAAMMQPHVDDVYRMHGLTPPHLERNLEQVRHGGSDLIGLDWLAVEVKWHKDRAIGAWWNQVLEAAGTTRTPVLVYRGNNEPWRVVMFGYLLPMLPGVVAQLPRIRSPVDIPADAFLAWLRVTIALHLEMSGHHKRLEAP